MRISHQVETPLTVGQRVRWRDREAPRPEAERLVGRVVWLSLSWDGRVLTLDGVGVRWADHPPAWDEEDAFAADELDQLEVLPAMNDT